MRSQTDRPLRLLRNATGETGDPPPGAIGIEPESALEELLQQIDRRFPYRGKGLLDGLEDGVLRITEDRSPNGSLRSSPDLTALRRAVLADPRTLSASRISDRRGTRYLAIVTRFDPAMTDITPWDLSALDQRGGDTGAPDRSSEAGNPAGRWDAAFGLVHQIDAIWPGRSKEHDGIWEGEDPAVPGSGFPARASVVFVGLTQDARQGLTGADLLKIAAAVENDPRFLWYRLNPFRLVLDSEKLANETPWDLSSIRRPDKVAAGDTGMPSGRCLSSPVFAWTLLDPEWLPTRLFGLGTDGRPLVVPFDMKNLAHLRAMQWCATNRWRKFAWPDVVVRASAAPSSLEVPGVPLEVMNGGKRHDFVGWYLDKEAPWRGMETVYGAADAPFSIAPPITPMSGPDRGRIVGYPIDPMDWSKGIGPRVPMGNELGDAGAPAPTGRPTVAVDGGWTMVDAKWLPDAALYGMPITAQNVAQVRAIWPKELASVRDVELFKALWWVKPWITNDYSPKNPTRLNSGLARLFNPAQPWRGAALGIFGTDNDQADLPRITPTNQNRGKVIGRPHDPLDWSKGADVGGARATLDREGNSIPWYGWENSEPWPGGEAGDPARGARHVPGAESGRIANDTPLFSDSGSWASFLGTVPAGTYVTILAEGGVTGQRPKTRVKLWGGVQGWVWSDMIVDNPPGGDGEVGAPASSHGSLQVPEAGDPRGESGPMVPPREAARSDLELPAIVLGGLAGIVG